MSKTHLKFSPTIEEIINQGKRKFYTVFSGLNNSGKSLTLKWLKVKFGVTAYMVGTNRFYHVHQFSTGLKDPNLMHNLEQNFMQTFWQDTFNHEQNFIDLNTVIVSLGNTKRKELFDICSDLLNCEIELKRVDPENDFSPTFIDVNGQNLSVASTGTRLLMTLIGILLDDRINIFLIDEPELGLSPKIQSIFSNFILNDEYRNKYFSHIQNIFVSTHSHLFLNRKDITSNFIVTKEINNINLKQIQNINEFHRLQFNLLGNDFESMFFPSAILIVEGKTDQEYLDRVVQLHFPDKRISVLHANSDSQIKEKINGLKVAFGDIVKSPFRSRLFVVLDVTHQRSLKADLIGMGMESQNIIIWEKNGIEYYYPTSIMSSIYSCSEQNLDELQMEGDRISMNGIFKTKNDLCKEILLRIDTQTVLPLELQTKLIEPLKIAVS